MQGLFEGGPYMRKYVKGLFFYFEAFLNHPHTNVRTFLLHIVRENWHFLDYIPTHPYVLT